MHEAMIQLLRDLEWAGRARVAPRGMGGHVTQYLPSCPLCRGIKPSEQANHEFTPEAIGHRPDCRLYQQLRKIGGYK